jgi:hypothetical protein
MDDSGIGVEPDLDFRHRAIACKLAKSLVEKGIEMVD